MIVNLQLSWDRAGYGEPLLLLHGIGTTHADFTALRPALDGEYEVLAPDLPGHGESAPLTGRPNIAAIVDALEADLDALGLGRVHVLGSSGRASRSSWPSAAGPGPWWRSPRPGSACHPSGSTRVP